MREASKLLAGITAISGIALVPASAAGGWKYQVIPNDGHVLTFSDDGKVTFYLDAAAGLRCTSNIRARPKKTARRASRSRRGKTG
jgi:hypothetical protein